MKWDEKMKFINYNKKITGNFDAYPCLLRPHLIDLVQSWLQNIVEHPQNCRRHHDQEKLAPAVARGGIGNDRNLSSGGGMGG